MPRNNLSRRYNPELAERNDHWDRKFCALFWSPFEIDTVQFRTEDGRVEELPASEEEDEEDQAGEVVLGKESFCSDSNPQGEIVEHLSTQMESLEVIDTDSSEVDPLALVAVTVSESSSSSSDEDDNANLPFPCPECPKRFRLVQYLRAHSVVHTGERPFGCDCGKSFRHRAALYHHRKRTGHQDWQMGTAGATAPSAGVRCNVCGQLFRSSGFLARHTATACAKFRVVTQKRKEGGEEEG